MRESVSFFLSSIEYAFCATIAANSVVVSIFRSARARNDLSCDRPCIWLFAIRLKNFLELRFVVMVRYDPLQGSLICLAVDRAAYPRGGVTR